jgi:heparan-alpha-glucosaminide N-acetyltransferase
MSSPPPGISPSPGLSPSPAVSPSPARISSVDAYRGFVMFLMMAEVLRLRKISKLLPDSETWQFLALQQTHVEWRGCSLHDLIQPSFSFLVGVALPFSIASRRIRGQAGWVSTLHATWRAVVLIFLGIFLRSIGQSQTNFTFEDTLTQIGLGYVFLFALGHVRERWQWLALIVILIGYWGAFALYPLPGPDFDYKAVNGLPEQDRPTGFAAHWDKNTNAAWAFDQWFLNLFPRKQPFIANSGGYATLSFIPTLGTMILGLIAGGWLRTLRSSWSKIGRFIAIGVVLLAMGWALDNYGICPNVKRLWTPAWVLFSGGWCFLILALFSILLDTGLPGGWSFPLKVIGANSIMAYVTAHLIDDFVVSSFKTHFGENVFNYWKPYDTLASGITLLLVYWLILFWMYRRKVFVRI